LVYRFLLKNKKRINIDIISTILLLVNYLPSADEAFQPLVIFLAIFFLLILIKDSFCCPIRLRLTDCFIISRTFDGKLFNSLPEIKENKFIFLLIIKETYFQIRTSVQFDILNLLDMLYYFDQPEIFENVKPNIEDYTLLSYLWL